MKVVRTRYNYRDVAFYREPWDYAAYLYMTPVDHKFSDWCGETYCIMDCSIPLSTF